MKYLKTYNKLFESITRDDITEIYQTINDILLELKDRDFKIEITPDEPPYLSGYLEDPWLLISISSNNTFRFSDISDVYYTLSEYLSDFKLFFHPRSDVEKVTGKPYRRYIDRHSIYRCDIYFKYNLFQIK